MTAPFCPSCRHDEAKPIVGLPNDWKCERFGWRFRIKLYGSTSDPDPGAGEIAKALTEQLGERVTVKAVREALRAAEQLAEAA